LLRRTAAALAVFAVRVDAHVSHGTMAKCQNIYESKTQITGVAAMFSLVAPLGAHAQSSFEPISTPDNTYQSGTTKLMINAPNS
jgi:hypothetical protein